jgi:hypothetical protein
VEGIQPMSFGEIYAGENIEIGKMRKSVEDYEERE